MIINLVTGKLLIGGEPLKTLPEAYLKTESYQKLFGDQILEVVPSREKNMDYCTVHPVDGNDIHFSLRRAGGKKGVDARIRIQRGSETFDYAAPDQIFGRLDLVHIPDKVIQNCTFWYIASSDSFALFPCKSPLSALGSLDSGPEWRLKRVQDEKLWTLYRFNGQYLLKKTAFVSRRLQDMLKGLESEDGILVLYNDTEKRATVDLPSLQLNFYIENGDFEVKSVQFTGMRIDTIQGVGTLVGLQSFLGLCSIDNHAERALLVPSGRISLSRGIHCITSIVRQDQGKPFYFKLDSKLGRLVGDGSLQSTLRLAHLHAVTSFCFPDPFTKCSGSMRAMEILTSEAVRSRSSYTEEDCQALVEISAISAQRTLSGIYQAVHWRSHRLPLLQPPHFHLVVLDLMNKIQKFGFFGNIPEIESRKLPHTEVNLLRRDKNRSSWFQLIDDSRITLGQNLEEDRGYSGRGRNQNSKRARLVFQTIRSCLDPSFALCEDLSGLNAEKVIERISSRYEISITGPQPIVFDELQHHQRWLEAPDIVFSESWCPFYAALQTAQSQFSIYQLRAWVATVAFSVHSDTKLVQMIAALISDPLLSSTGPTILQEPSFGFQYGNAFQEDKLEELIKGCCNDFEGCPESNFSGSDKKARQKAQAAWRKAKKSAVTKFTEKIGSQWPLKRFEAMKLPQFHDRDTYIDTKEAWDLTKDVCRQWWKLEQLSKYFEILIEKIQQCPVREVQVPPCQFSHAEPKSRSVLDVDVYNAPCPGTQFSDHIPELTTVQLIPLPYDDAKVTELHSNCESLFNSQFAAVYFGKLSQSIEALGCKLFPAQIELNSNDGASLKEELCRYKDSIQAHYDELLGWFENVLHHVSSVPPHLRLIFQSKLWPQIAVRNILHRLRRNSWTQLEESWKRRILAFAITLVQLQQAERMIRLLCSGDESSLMRELDNLKLRAELRYSCPESLLLEIEGDMKIRDVQWESAQSISNPEGNKNATMQLRMGEGKSSVIIPLIALLATHDEVLLRVIVSKPQFNQMEATLILKLGGLINRPIHYMPFNRGTEISNTAISAMEEMCRDCVARGGVVLVQPEHLLSLQLKSQVVSIEQEAQLGRRLSSFYFRLGDISKDVIDESDDILSPKSELIYTIGTQMRVELSPQRWIIIQEVLGIVAEQAMAIWKEQGNTMPHQHVDMLSSQLENPGFMEVYNTGEGRFPHVHLTKDTGYEALFERVAKKICFNGLSELAVGPYTENTKRILMEYFTKQNVDTQTLAELESSPIWKTHSRSILLVRGLLSSGVVAFALGRRWRVNYGPDPLRENTKLAVPYRAKDAPTANSEFAQPDVVIVLTCLSYYYGGLDNSEFLEVLKLVLQSDQGDTEYLTWTSSFEEHIPVELRCLEGVNTDDRSGIEKLFALLRYSKRVIDYFLTHVVFAKEIKEFPSKVSASGWDLARQSADYAVTGFSGTNDAQYILPLFMDKMPLETHTDALVLSHVLDHKNDVHLMPPDIEDRLTAEAFITTVSQMGSEIRVIIDVGALIIEMSNEEVARTWLQKSDPAHVHAAIFFSESDKPMVLDRKNQLEALEKSHYISQMELCIVFLDDVHTRGIDLRLPTDFRAIVTLGSGMTKDRLMQGKNQILSYQCYHRLKELSGLTLLLACMRMRRLDSGQSVTFYIPQEIGKKIRAVVQHEEALDVSDVVTWTIDETLKDIQHMAQLWAVQGRKYHSASGKRNQLYQSCTRVLEHDEDDSEIREISKCFQESESMSLEQRYCARNNRGSATMVDNAAMTQIVDRLRLLGIDESTSPQGMQEEQERMLAPENERETQVQVIYKAIAANHSIESELESFIRNGYLNMPEAILDTWPWFRPAFSSLSNTSVSDLMGLYDGPAGVLVTDDWRRTIHHDPFNRSRNDMFVKDVTWVLISYDPRPQQHNRRRWYVLIISPYEAEMLFKDIEQSKTVSLHCYKPRQKLQAKSLDDLESCTINRQKNRPPLPRALTIELNLFAAQLYFDTYKEYTEVCEFLGLPWLPDMISTDGVLGNDGGIGFKKNPVQFLKTWLSSIRCPSRCIQSTHMSRMLNGHFLTERDFPPRVKRLRDEEDAEPSRVKEETIQDELMDDAAQGCETKTEDTEGEEPATVWRTRYARRAKRLKIEEEEGIDSDENPDEDSDEDSLYAPGP